MIARCFEPKPPYPQVDKQKRRTNTFPMRHRTQPTGTLYTPTSRPRVPKSVFRGLALLLVFGGLLAAGWLHPTIHGLVSQAWVQGWALLGHEVVTIDVVSTPSRVSLFVDGEPITKLPIEIAKDTNVHSLMAVAPGYEPTTIPLRPSIPQRVIINLKPMK